MIKQFIPQEVCLKCQGCCRFSHSETIWAPVGIKPILREDYYTCPNFLAQTNRCSIYERRPFDCWLYPFILEKRGNKIFLSLHLSCPFAKNNLNKKEFKDYIKYLKGILQKDVLKEHIFLVQDYTAFQDEIKPIFCLYENKPSRTKR